jgi:hypothetical protein
MSAVQSIRPLSTATIPNGAFSRVQKVVSTLSADGGAEAVSSRQQSVATLLSIDKKPVIAPSSAPIGILLATPIGKCLLCVITGIEMVDKPVAVPQVLE